MSDENYNAPKETLNYTPSPWKISGDLILNSSDQLIAVVAKNRNGLVGDKEANAWLIKEAPELLTVLQLVLKLSSKNIAWADDARAVIARATGL